MQRHVLLVEDERDLGAQIVEHLADAGYRTTWWKEGRRVDKGDLTGIDLVVLDIMLPGTYGMDVLKEIRAVSDIPVLVLSARNDSVTKVRALQLGADDYMTKPFWPEELVERVKARLRRPILARHSVMEVGPLRIDRETREVQLREVRLELTRVEFDFLATLAARPGAAMTRKHLAEAVLDPERDGNERTLDVHVSRLRKKLQGDEALIETVWGIGYRLAAPEER